MTPRAHLNQRWDDPKSEYYEQLRQRFLPSELKAVPVCQEERLLRAACDWCHHRTEHDPWSDAGLSDPYALLETLEAGRRQFRCVEFSILTAGVLTALGVRSRILGLRTIDAETRESGAGHVAVEAYCKSLGGWTFLDPQFAYVAVHRSRGFNAHELSRSFSGPATELIESLPQEYREFLPQYLYYLDTRIDQRFSCANRAPESVTLCPPGASHPTLFQRTLRLEHVTYTNDFELFYEAGRS